MQTLSFFFFVGEIQAARYSQRKLDKFPAGCSLKLENQSSGLPSHPVYQQAQKN